MKYLMVCLVFCFAIHASEIVPSPIIAQLEQEINTLKARIAENQHLEDNQEIESEQFMIADWDKYGKKLIDIQHIQTERYMLQQRLEELEKRKAALLANTITPR